ncbi:DUF4129 domain-containing protein [Brevundimonas sp. NIBR11]|uniref:DUF4129 domain-containing protein n=1 Tax=Brevundimonas sp. NIBR11 TaxID=3015999 RepID=UPI0022F0AA12|nr:DUF4129 domain-containing protein [Brevundimonas sp. NIBR11]WGM31544.1 hypothetical protein KKHFBJBL_01791 [Brevundimonas sp. NIBR11]
MLLTARLPVQQNTDPAPDTLAQAHSRLIADDRLQFDRTGFTPPEVPGWLNWVGEALRAIAPLLEIVFWVGLAVVVAMIAWFIVREILRLRMPRSKAEAVVAVDQSEWRPDEATARNLLAGADDLAAEGRYAEAAHLLLMRSVEDIEKRAPRAIKVSLTTREIAGTSSLPEAARPAFVHIAQVVERSLFGGRPVDARDFADCRRAYEDFALPAGWRS